MTEELAPLLPEDAFDLAQVVDVVAGEHVRDVLDGFLAALGVHSILFPLLGGQGFEQREIGFPNYAKLFDGFAGIALCLMPAGHPGILIEGRDCSSRSAKNQAHAKAADAEIDFLPAST